MNTIRLIKHTVLLFVSTSYSVLRGMMVEGLTILLKLLWTQSLHFNHAHLKTQTWHKFLMFFRLSLSSFFSLLQTYTIKRGSEYGLVQYSKGGKPSTVKGEWSDFQII